jgi:hypothetical protein
MTEILESVVAGLFWGMPLLLLILLISRGLPEDRGTALLVAYPIFFGAQVALAKTLGMMGLLTTPAVRLAYALCVALLTVAYFRRRPRGAPASPAPLVSGPDSDTLLIRRIVLGTVGAVLAGLALFSLLSPVHVWDVLAYHMPMVASYVQNGTLEAWPTQDLRQIYRVNAGELQILNVAILARSDAWVELPGLVALGVFLVAAHQLARLASPRRVLSCLVVGLVLTAPQILFGAATAKNDLVFSAVLLSAFFWMIRAGESTGDGQTLPLVWAALCGALAAATKVMGLNVLGAVGLLALYLLLRGRLRFHHVLIFGGVAATTLLALAGDLYWGNFTRSSVPVGVAPGEVHFTVGLANLVEAVRFYVYDLSFKRLVVPQVIEHDFMHYGYLFPIMLVLGVVAGFRSLRRRAGALGSLALVGAALFLSVIALRLPIGWDQRFMIWLVPTLAVLAASLVQHLHARHLLALTAGAAALALVNLSLVLTREGDGLLPRSAMHLATTGTLARYLDVPNSRYSFMNDGFDVLDGEAVPQDSVLYVGTDDSWMYPAWGPRFTRHVEGVWNAEHTAEQVGSLRFRFLILEESALPEIRGAVELQADASGYVILTRANGRLIYLRAEG